jgi:hypothetical protein
MSCNFDRTLSGCRCRAVVRTAGKAGECQGSLCRYILKRLDDRDKIWRMSKLDWSSYEACMRADMQAKACALESCGA